MVKFDNGVVRPKPAPDFLAQDDLPRIFQQQQQNLEGLLPKAEPDPMFAQLTGAHV
jgi:hypothetical protein